MIASLPMYERAETLDALHALWSGVRDALLEQGIDAPKHLTPKACGLNVWLDEKLILSQTCGLPFRTALHPHVHLVGSPQVRLPACPPGYYRSVIVVRANDARATLKEFEFSRVICNEVGSQSGYAALKNHWQNAGLSWPNAPRFSGAHRASALAVASADADLAALDALSYHLMQQHDAFTRELRVLEYTQPTPTLPFICSKQFDAALVNQALKTGIRSLNEIQQNTLSLYGLVDIPVETYLAVPTPDECRIK